MLCLIDICQISLCERCIRAKLRGEEQISHWKFQLLVPLHILKIYQAPLPLVNTLHKR